MVFPCAAGNCIARPRRRQIARWLAAVAIVVSLDSSAVGTPLYDASSAKLPSDVAWGWAFGANGSSFLRGMTGNSTYLDTTPLMSDKAGYNLSVGSGLNSATGFVLDFSLQVTDELHNTNNRSGFSVIALDSAARGVELSFWSNENEVWTKNADSAFSHAESVTIDSVSDARSYRLTFLGTQYSLASDGAPTLIGTLRNYAAATVPLSLAWFVYSQPNYIFFGDNTSSASANFELSSITLAPVPEPAEWALMLVGLGCVVAVARRQREYRRKRMAR